MWQMAKAHPISQARGGNLSSILLPVAANKDWLAISVLILIAANTDWL
jgi:hypothetical protein